METAVQVSQLGLEIECKRIIGAVSKTWMAHVQVSPRLAEGSTQVEEADTAIAKAQVLVVFGVTVRRIWLKFNDIIACISYALYPMGITHFNHDRPW